MTIQTRPTTALDKDDFYVDCPTAPPATITPPLPPQQTPSPTPQKAEQNRPITQRVRESGASEEVIEEMTEQPSEPQHVPRDPTCDADFSVSWHYLLELAD